MSVLIVAVVLGAAAVIFSGKAGSIVHRAEVLVGSAAGPAVEPEREVEELNAARRWARRCTPLPLRR